MADESNFSTCQETGMISYRDIQSDIDQIDGPQRCCVTVRCRRPRHCHPARVWSRSLVSGYGRIFVGRGLLVLKLSGCSIFVVVVVMLPLVGDLSRLERS
uniref:Uncharacterized protein n=1 Tax=Onchocerca volvulus TaxID=6282 RepID=A0A8R1Y644_ONCVO